MKPDPGPCKAHYEMWYYDPEWKECEVFIYGGCDGNYNNFYTKEDCEYACMHKEPYGKISHNSYISYLMVEYWVMKFSQQSSCCATKLKSVTVLTGGVPGHMSHTWGWIPGHVTRVVSHISLYGGPAGFRSRDIQEGSGS